MAKMKFGCRLLVFHRVWRTRRQWAERDAVAGREYVDFCRLSKDNGGQPLSKGNTIRDRMRCIAGSRGRLGKFLCRSMPAKLSRLGTLLGLVCREKLQDISSLISCSKQFDRPPRHQKHPQPGAEEASGSTATTMPEAGLSPEGKRRCFGAGQAKVY